MVNEKVGSWLDSFGALASWACAVHCLVLPVLVGFVPFLGLSYLLSETVERYLVFVSIALAALSFLPAYFRKHKKLHSILLAAMGIFLIVMTHQLFEESLIARATFLILGAVLVSSAHLLNRRMCRNCEVCDH